MTNGAHRIGQVRVFTGGRNFGTADIRWGLAGIPHVPRNGGVGVAGGHIMMYETFRGGRLQPGDTATSYWSMHMLEDELGTGYTMAHEWGHYYLGLYDESEPHVCGAKEEVKPSIMANQWKATDGDSRFDWLNLSIGRNKGGDFEIRKSTCQYFAYGEGAWPVLSRPTDDDPSDGTSTAFRSLGPRVFYPELAFVAPTGEVRRRLDLPSPMARKDLSVIWMASRTVLEIVLDRSGSMAGPKLAQAKAAAMLLVDQAVLGETSIGLTVFDHTVTNLLPITDLDSADARAKVKAIIGDVITAGTTAIGDAAALALEKLRARKGDGETRVVFLLTDGQNNAGRDPAATVSEFTESRVPLFTFGYGADVDEKALNALSTATGGRYYSSPTTLSALTTAFREATQVAVSSAGAGAGELTPTPARPAARAIPVDAAVGRLQVSVVVPPGANASQVQLVTAGGITVPASSTTAAGAETLVLFDVESPEGGTWQLLANTTSGAPAFTFGVTAIQQGVGYTMNTGIRGGGLTVSAPGPVIVEARLSRRLPIAGADVSASVTMPGGATSIFQMNDRGVFPDDTADDGHYAGVFVPSGAGVYAVSVEFSNPSGRAFETYEGALITPGTWAAGETESLREAFVRSETVHVTVLSDDASAAPRVLSSPASVDAAPGASVTFDAGVLASPAPAYRWQRRQVGSSVWVDLMDGAAAGVQILGATTPQLRLDGVTAEWFDSEFRVQVSNVAGSATSSTAWLRQQPGTVALDRTWLHFVGAAADAAVTPPQVITILAAGTPAPSWTASASAPWITLGAAAGRGSGTLMVGVDHTAAPVSARGTVTVTSADLTAPPQVVTVTFERRAPERGERPFGQVDTPAQDSRSMQGAIGVTGWVLDDIGVQSVHVYRQCLPFDNPASCQFVLGDHVVWLGEAQRVPGARPDVEVAYPAMPANQTAGWGFLLLSNLLPHVPRAAAEGGGQGTFQLHVIATDVEGQQVRLGRTVADSTPTTISVDNEAAASPFGTIDTPRAGETVSGMVANFGWALTPDSNTRAGDTDDVVIPPTGRTMTVFVDGQPVGLVTYDQCRGTAGPRIADDAWCDDDIASVFGALGTRFRNLDAGRGAIGSFLLNTSTMRNGMHTIAWSVTDSLRRTSGLGSRFFTVLNSDSQAPRVMASRAVATSSPAGDAEIAARVGFDLHAPWTPLRASLDGTYHVRLSPMNRVEITFGAAVESVVMVAPDGSARELPPGTFLDGQRFSWMPPVGYIGEYRFAVTMAGRLVDLRVTIAASASTSETPAIRMYLDDARGDAGVVQMDGWAFDPEAAIGSGIGAVHVWARSLAAHGGWAAEPFFLGEATLDQARPDVASAFPGASSHTGWRLRQAVAPGTYELTAYAWNVRTGRFDDARQVVVIVK